MINILLNKNKYKSVFKILKMNNKSEKNKGDKKYESYVISHFTVQKEEYITKRGSHLFNYLLQSDDFLNILKSKKGLRILDVGCGAGQFLESINTNFPGNELHGVDINPSFIEYAKKYKKGINFKIGSAYHLPYENDYFDIITAETVLHHLIGSTREASKRLMKDALNEMVRVCKNDALIFIMEDIVSYKFQSHLMFFVTKTLARFGITLHYFDIDKDVVVSFYTANELCESLKRCGVEIINKERIIPKCKLRFRLTLTCLDFFYVIGKIKKE